MKSEILTGSRSQESKKTDAGHLGFLIQRGSSPFTNNRDDQTMFGLRGSGRRNNESFVSLVHLHAHLTLKPLHPKEHQQELTYYDYNLGWQREPW